MEMIADPIAYPYTSTGNGRVQQLTGLLQGGGLILAGMDKNGVLLQAEQNNNIGSAREKMGLLRSGAALKTIFYQPEAWLLTPTQLFKEEEATTWLCQLFPCLPGEVKSIYLSRAGLHLTYAEPASLMDELSPLQLPLSFRPLPQCLLTAPDEGFLFCVLDGQALGFLQYGGQLKWYQQFDCTTPEDILWQALQAATNAGLHSSDINLQLWSTMPESHTWLEFLSGYFMIQTDSEQAWQPVRALFQAMSACAS